ncbi:MAG: adenylate/guanylate cyclase domain-containing protein [Candidatus Tectimicrobiota bacterium]
MTKIFINYRREDSAGYAGRLYDRLSARFGAKKVFMDIDTLEPGIDFSEDIERAIHQCDVLLILIGTRWLSAVDSTGKRRLDNPNDYVRREIQVGFTRNIHALPVLLGGAVMPNFRDLPIDLTKLSRINALELSDTRWHTDVDKLLETVKKLPIAAQRRPRFSQWFDRGKIDREIVDKYLPPQLVKLLAKAKMTPRLGGSSGIRTAYFTDIASFTSISEVLSNNQLFELVNEYLTVMTDILLAEGGTLDKYEGDAIIAFFGAPTEQPDHAARAVRVALWMQQALAQLRDKWHDEGNKWPDVVKDMRMRIGLCSGDIVVGNMGSDRHMVYTMIGKVVNTAARLEATSKQYGIYIQCTIDTLMLAGSTDFEWRYIDKVKSVEKLESLETVEILAFKDQLSPTLRQMRDIYHHGIELYRQQQWDEAMAKFAESDRIEEVFPQRPTTPSQVYIKRCEFFKENPPDADWDGAWTLKRSES